MHKNYLLSTIYFCSYFINLFWLKNSFGSSPPQQGVRSRGASLRTEETISDRLNLKKKQDFVLHIK